MRKPKQVVVLCGGLGTRLLPFTETLPKPMIQCNQKPFLLYLLEQMSEQGFKEFVLLTGYLGRVIEDFFGDGSEWGWTIHYSNGPVDWDTGKRIWEAKSMLKERFVLLYSDNFAPFSFEKIFALHEKNQTALTFTLSPKYPGNVALDSFGIVSKYDNNRSDSTLNFVEIGYMILEKYETFNFFDTPECSFSRIIEKMSVQRQVSGFVQYDNYHSISDPSRWRRAEEYLDPKKIILIDRDGVINKKALKGEYISSWNEFEWIADTRIAMKTLAQRGFKFIVITNQAGIARGMVNLKDLEKIHLNMKNELLSDGIEVLDIYICPHHWREDCGCRKPKPGLFFDASKDWNFRLDMTFFIGDDPRDCQAAFNAGSKSIFIGDISKIENLAVEEMPMHCFSSLIEAVPILKNYFDYNTHYDYN